MKYVVGTEFLVIFRRDYGGLPWVHGTYHTLELAQAALKAAEAIEAATSQAMAAAGSEEERKILVTRIETRTLFHDTAKIDTTVRPEKEIPEYVEAK